MLNRVSAPIFLFRPLSFVIDYGTSSTCDRRYLVITSLTIFVSVQIVLLVVCLPSLLGDLMLELHCQSKHIRFDIFFIFRHHNYIGAWAFCVDCEEAKRFVEASNM